MSAPAARKVKRIPINGGSDPPMSGPTRLPAMIPEDRTPRAQPQRFLGVCVATRTVEPDANPPSKPARSRRPTSCQTSCAIPIKDMMMAIPKLARINMGLRP